MTKFCHYCNEEVETYVVDREGTKEICCIRCGMVCEVLEKPPHASHVEEKKAEVKVVKEVVKEVVEVKRPVIIKKFKPVDLVVVVDESSAISEKVKERLLKYSLGREVETCTGGIEFVSRAMEMMKGGTPPSLVVLDFGMTEIDGITTAKILRAMEKGGKIPKPIPIIFLTTVDANEHLEKIISGYGPGAWINKGSSSFDTSLSDNIIRLFPENIYTVTQMQ